jgi:hypothetical protein
MMHVGDEAEIGLRDDGWRWKKGISRKWYHTFDMYVTTYYLTHQMRGGDVGPDLVSCCSWPGVFMGGKGMMRWFRPVSPFPDWPTRFLTRVRLGEILDARHSDAIGYLT